MSESTRRPGAAPKNELNQGSKTRARRFFSRALPTLLIVAAPLAMTVASVEGSDGGVGPGGGGDGQASSSKSKYQRLWEKQSANNRRWARRTSECESGGDANIHGGGGSYHGAFQFMKSTWRSAPKSVGRDPHKKSWKTQAVVAIYLKKRDGKGHWPNCG
jgi:hypothetical protein